MKIITKTPTINEYLKITDSYEFKLTDDTIQICDLYSHNTDINPYNEALKIDLIDQSNGEALKLFTLSPEIDCYDYDKESEIYQILVKYSDAFSRNYWTHLIFSQNLDYFIIRVIKDNNDVLDWLISTIGLFTNGYTLYNSNHDFILLLRDTLKYIDFLDY